MGKLFTEALGNLFTEEVGKLLTRLLGNYLTELLGKVLDIYRSWVRRGKVASIAFLASLRRFFFKVTI